MIKALVFGDDRKIRELLVDSLVDAAYDVIQAENGSEAFEQAVRHIPDIVLLDVMMPEIDGLGVLRRFRRNSSNEFTPIVMLAPISATQSEQEARNLGASHYLTEPFYTDTLEVTIIRFESVPGDQKGE